MPHTGADDDRISAEDDVNDEELVQYCTGCAEFFRALGHPVRLALVKKISSGEFCVNDLQRSVQQSQPSVSQHLRVLRNRGIIRPVRHGNRTCYAIADARMARVLALLEEMHLKED